MVLELVLMTSGVFWQEIHCWMELGWNLVDCNQHQEEEIEVHCQHLKMMGKVLEQLLMKKQLGEQLLAVFVAEVH